MTHDDYVDGILLIGCVPWSHHFRIDPRIEHGFGRSSDLTGDTSDGRDRGFHGFRLNEDGCTVDGASVRNSASVRCHGSACEVAFRRCSGNVSV